MQCNLSKVHGGKAKSSRVESLCFLDCMQMVSHPLPTWLPQGGWLTIRLTADGQPARSRLQLMLTALSLHWSNASSIESILYWASAGSIESVLG